MTARGYEPSGQGYATAEDGLSSMEICQDIMECSKNLATTYTMAALESADPSIRRSFRQMGRDCERVAYRAFEILHANGHYDVKGASPTECRQVEDMLDSFRRGEAVPNARAPRSPANWSRAGAFESERGYAGDRRPGAFEAERAWADRRAGIEAERAAYNTDRTFGNGATSYGSERTSAYGTARSERTELPDWARSRV